MSDELLKRLETGHDKECAMSYGMHEHCCDCSYTVRQEAAARVRELEAERSAMIDNVRFARERAERAEAAVVTITRELSERAADYKAERDALRAVNERLRANWCASQDFVTGLIRWAQQQGLPAVVKKANELGEKYNAALAGEKP